MRKIRLGKTEIQASSVSFGVLPLQRVQVTEASVILQRAYDNEINYYDTARTYSDSEEKIGIALSNVRKNIIIATKSPGLTGEAVRKDMETSLRMLKTDYLDVLQLHNPAFCPKPGSEDGIYDALEKAKAQGYILHIGITNHRAPVALEAIESGLYELLQFPLSYLSSSSELKVKELCSSADMGFVAMKPLGGGVLQNARAVFQFFEEHQDALPIYGIQHMHELEEFINLAQRPPTAEELVELLAIQEKDRAELKGNFCRNCGYCLPCPKGIKVDHVCRSYYNLRRMPIRNMINEEWKKSMEDTKNCIRCGACSKRCPYELDPPSRFELMYQDYMEAYNRYTKNEEPK